MEFLPSKKIPHADGLPRLIPKIREPLEETVIASLSSKMDIKNVLYNTVKELLFTLEEIMFKAKFDKFITEKKEIMDQKKNKGNNIFSICNSILLYGDWVMIPAVLTKKNLEGFSYRTSNMNKEIENLVKTCKNCALVAKAPPVKFSPWPKTDKPSSMLAQ